MESNRYNQALKRALHSMEEMHDLLLMKKIKLIERDIELKKTKMLMLEVQDLYETYRFLRRAVLLSKSDGPGKKVASLMAQFMEDQKVEKQEFYQTRLKK